MSAIRYPNESAEYRQARDELLEAEIALRQQMENVAAKRRALPRGGELAQDYTFEELVDGQRRETRFPDLFEGDKDTLVLYSFMFSAEMEAACPMCTAFVDGIAGQLHHLSQRVNVAVVAKHDVQTLEELKRSRGWGGLRLLSWRNNSYGQDYFGERPDGQWTIMNVFERDGSTIRHFWGSEMTFCKGIEGGNQRHLDTAWALWGVLDMTREGRGETFFPQLSYQK